ncbi:MAG: ribosome maturation factor RimP [Robiginitomaculum sp.]|nr:MAG: ribosome maturation factor RimP [Robiginitomaculum sp.]PHQ66304.1 MAG: ribosome maturation factor RimP [Robiginitomaculum sp.]
MKTKTNMDERILAIAIPVAADMGYGIVRIRVQGGNRSVVQIMAERLSDGKMNVADCAQLSRALSSTFEVEDPIDDAYVLEVSSPGLDRPLTDMKHFEQYSGQLARLELDRFVEGRKRFRGILAGIDGDNVAIDLDKEDETALIPFAWISEAKLLITDEVIKKGQKKPKEKSQEKSQKKSNKKKSNKKNSPQKGDT